MKPFKKIKKEDIRETPEWLKAVTERVKNSSLSKMSEEEVGEWVETLAERAAAKRTKQVTK